jgi:hypothetical protein
MDLATALKSTSLGSASWKHADLSATPVGFIYSSPCSTLPGRTPEISVVSTPHLRAGASRGASLLE